MTFQISALPYEPFAPLFALDDDALIANGSRRVVADKPGGFPCRVSLADATPGDTLILTNYQHQEAHTPFRAAHAIYIREGATRAEPAVGEVPRLLRSRILSLRGFDAEGMMVAADLADGTALESAVDTMLADPAVDYIHLHYARPGCYAARVDRA